MIEILIIVEAEADFRTASVLADRVIVEKAPDWFRDLVDDSPDTLDYHRKWIGFENEPFSCWKHIKKLQKTRYPRLRALGHHKGEKLGSDGAATRKILLMAQQERKTRPALQAVVLIRDLDSQAMERKKSLELMRDDFKDEFAVVLGISDTKREAWVLNGFEPQNKDEKKALHRLCDELKFNPCLDAHRLRTITRGVTQTQKRDVKWVLDRLTGGDYSREERCWKETTLDVLRERGEHTYLTRYLKEVEDLLLPLIVN